ncbi:MAG: hypothetical protein ORN98_01610 [Alphaproteobacteria bacterium]|nr:hypothetical protein [Alphaproteobacteria bacterium]
MTASTTARNTIERIGRERVFKMATATVINQGTMVMLDAAGLAKPAATGDAARPVVGMATAFPNNPFPAAGEGQTKVKVQKGVFKFNNAAGADAVTFAHVEGKAYVMDDNTVAGVAGANRPVAGIVDDIDEDGGIWVRF